MASIERVADGYRARWRTPEGASRSKTFRRKAEAERHLVGVEHSKLTGAYIDPQAGRVTLGSYAKAWHASQVWRPSTGNRLEVALRREILPTFGSRAIASIRPSEVQAWIRGMAERQSPATVRLTSRVLSSVYKAAVRDRVVITNPCDGMKLPKASPRQIVPLRTEVVQQIIAAMPEEYRALVVLGAGTGMRQGEAFGLTLDRIDFLRRTVKVDRQLLSLPGKPAHLGPLKTAASYRTIPAPQVVVDVLAAHLYSFEPTDEGLVFRGQDGGPIRRSTFNTLWHGIARPAGVPPREGMHSLRHYYASLLIRSGCSVKVVQARLGHSNAGQTLDTYSHLWPDDEDRTRAAVDAVLLPVPSTGRTTADGQG